MPKILIIGAGLAGLSAAAHLSSNGFSDLIILEAADRIGGRVYTRPFGSTQVEIGANWIHGPALSNSVFNLANQAGLMKTWQPLDRMKGFCYRSDGKAIDKQHSDTLWRLYQEWEAELPPFTHLDDRPCIEDYMKRRFEEEIHQFPAHVREDLRYVFNCLNNYQRFHCAGDIRDMPLPALIKQRIPGGNVQVLEGLSKICEYIAKQIPRNAIKLNSEVVKISTTNINKVDVRTRDGRTHEADHVVVATSLGVLKASHHSLFQPPLPAQKVAAINTIKFGKVAKIFLEWEKPFWRKGTGSIKFCWTDEEMKNLDSKKHWYRRIFSFDEVMNNASVLVGWLSGEEAVYMETLPDSEVIDTCTRLIRQFLRDPSVSEPSNLVRSNFNTNPHFRGSYIYVDYKTRPSTFEDYAAPILDRTGLPRIQFAGEATIAWAYSTMHGARTSGLREAQRLIDIYRPQPARL